MSDQVAPKSYIYIRKTRFLGSLKRRGFGIDFSMIFELILDRFLERLWKGFGEVFGAKLHTFFMLACMPCWKWFLDRFISNLNKFGKDFEQFLNDFSSPMYRFLQMRSLCQNQCEADVKTKRKLMSR